MKRQLGGLLIAVVVFLGSQMVGLVFLSLILRPVPNWAAFVVAIGGASYALYAFRHHVRQNEKA